MQFGLLLKFLETGR